MGFAQQLGRRVRRARIERGMTQSDLAQIAGVGANYVPRLERGELVPSVEAAYRIARALGVSLDGLCSRSGKGKTNTNVQEWVGMLNKADAAALRRVADVVEAVTPGSTRARVKAR